jgi:hypothetical protein
MINHNKIIGKKILLYPSISKEVLENKQADIIIFSLERNNMK